MSGTGSIADLIRRVESLSRPEFFQGMARALAGEALGQVDDAFRGQRSPYGERWKPRKGNYPWPILQKTGYGRNSWMLKEATPEGFRIEPAAQYLQFQQYGTRKGIDPREVVPVEAFGMGRIWGQALERAAVQYVRSVMR